MNNWCICWFYAYINEMHDLGSKIPSKNLIRQRCAGEFNSDVKGLKSIAVQLVLSHTLTYELNRVAQKIDNFWLIK
jgi:hypothetical protein